MRSFAAIAIATGLLILAPAGQGRNTASLTLVVNFTDSGVITVTLNGSPVGTTSGTPTVIPAGTYTVLLNGPGECINLPLFMLKGPGVNLQDDMLGGEVDTHSMPANFLPNSTYAWHSDKNQALVYTFKTTADVSSTPTPGASTPTSSSSTKKPTSEDIVGSANLPFRGTITGAVSAAGRLTFAYKGKSVVSLKAGKYTMTVNDKSSTWGFLVQKTKYAPVAITGMSFTGTHSKKVSLSAGRWAFELRSGKSVYSIVVLS